MTSRQMGWTGVGFLAVDALCEVAGPSGLGAVIINSTLFLCGIVFIVGGQIAKAIERAKG